MSSLPLPAGTTAHAQPCPEARTGFVFICPGRHEANRGYPCAAGTGANLNRVLEVLHQRRSDLFPSASRWQYVVTNSWDRVEYPALTGRSVPTEGEVLMPANLERLAREIAALERVVAFGLVVAHDFCPCIIGNKILRFARLYGFEHQVRDCFIKSVPQIRLGQGIRQHKSNTKNRCVAIGIGAAHLPTHPVPALFVHGFLQSATENFGGIVEGADADEIFTGSRRREFGRSAFEIRSGQCAILVIIDGAQGCPGFRLPMGGLFHAGIEEEVGLGGEKGRRTGGENEQDRRCLCRYFMDFVQHTDCYFVEVRRTPGLFSMLPFRRCTNRII